MRPPSKTYCWTAIVSTVLYYAEADVEYEIQALRSYKANTLGVDVVSLEANRRVLRTSR
jgi:hypothetical protein